MKVICFTHKTYDGEKAPDLTCKTCCSIFVEKVRTKNLEKRSIPEGATTPELPKVPQQAVPTPTKVAQHVVENKTSTAASYFLPFL